MKTNKSTAPKSTELADATKSKVSTSNPQIIMQPDNSTNSINSTSTVNSDNTVNSTKPANADNLVDNEQTATEATTIPTTSEPPKQQRKSDFTEFRDTFLAPAKLVNRHALNEHRGGPVESA